MANNGTWNGGMVDRMGYIMGDVIITGNAVRGINPENDIKRNADNGGSWSQAYKDGYIDGHRDQSYAHLIFTGFTMLLGDKSNLDWNQFYYHEGYKRGMFDAKDGYDSYYENYWGY
jgi:hypothetical protein